MGQRASSFDTPTPQALLSGMHDWRSQHPTATLREIEVELDTRLAHMRARMLEDLALDSYAARWQTDAPTPAPPCPHCGAALEDRGQKCRTLQTHGGHDLTLARSYGWCPTCQVGLFPPG
jgi:hypothetical protein